MAFSISGDTSKPISKNNIPMINIDFGGLAGNSFCLVSSTMVYCLCLYLTFNNELSVKGPLINIIHNLSA
jgi:hypothetical protein